MLNNSITGIFDGSFDGFLTLIHAHYYDKINFSRVVSEGNYQRDFSEEIYIAPDKEKALKVLKGIENKISKEAARIAFCAFNAYDEDRYTFVYHYLLKGFKVGGKINEQLTDSHVLAVIKLNRKVEMEAHHYKGFCRFEKTSGGVFYCKIEPKCSVLPIIAEHFTDRLKNQPWIIHDMTHNEAAIYDTKEYAIMPVPKNIQADIAEGEEVYKNLWKIFHKTIAIPERTNPRCQRTNLPLWFRKHMPEFEDSMPSENKNSSVPLIEYKE